MSEMVAEAGISLLYHAYIFKDHKDGERITAVSVATKQGEVVIEADYFIDATGDAQLAFLSDCPTMLGRESDNLCQPMTLCFRVRNADVEKFYASKPKLAEAHKKAREAGELINPRENVLVFKTPIHNVLHFNTTRVVKKNPTDPADVTEAELLAKAAEIRTALGDRALLRALHFLRENERVLAAKAALLSNDIPAFFKEILASGHSSFEYLQNVYTVKAVDEQGLSLALALTDGFMQTHEGAFRVHGGGFAGTILAFVKAEDAACYVQTMDAVLGEGSAMLLRVRPKGCVKLF
jgi:galactokinase